MNTVAIVLAGGRGTRFASYDSNPKPLIKVLGHTQLFWAVKGAYLSYRPDFFIFACRSDLLDGVCSEVKTFNFTFEYEILDVGDVTDGPAHTVEIAIQKSQQDISLSKFVVVDNDCFNLIAVDLAAIEEPFVTTTNSENPAHCFLELSQNGTVVAFHEKSIAGKIATSGNYAFTSSKQFLESLEATRRDLKKGDEIFMSSVMKKLTERIDVQALPVSSYFSLGTPDEISNINPSLIRYV